MADDDDFLLFYLDKTVKNDIIIESEAMFTSTLLVLC
jgi:hypothetical protein